MRLTSMWTFITALQWPVHGCNTTARVRLTLLPPPLQQSGDIRGGGGGSRYALAVVLQPCPSHCNAVMDIHVEVSLINDLLTNELFYHILQCNNTHKLRL